LVLTVQVSTTWVQGVLRTSASNFGTPLKACDSYCSLLSTNLARERLQIDSELLSIIIVSLLTSLPGVPTSMTLNLKNMGF